MMCFSSLRSVQVRVLRGRRGAGTEPHRPGPVGRRLNKDEDHVGEDSRDGEEPVGRRADVVEAHVIEEDLLDDERRDGLGEL